MLDAQLVECDKTEGRICITRRGANFNEAKGLIIPDDSKTNTAAMSAWIDTNRGKKRRKLNRKTSNRAVGSAASNAPPPKRSRKQKVGTDSASMAPAPANSSRTPLRIPYGNKEVALKLGARYCSEGWYAPPGVDLSVFGAGVVIKVGSWMTIFCRQSAIIKRESLLSTRPLHIVHEKIMPSASFSTSLQD